ncbi:MAG: HAD family phosphatase [Deltaproteobacteria bacterium]|nr:HAD family phosphatase [Deltaproteobacteria bacterium]
MIKLFVFDLGNVILPFDHAPIAAKLWERSEKKGVLSPDRIFAYLFDREQGLINGYETGRLSSLHFFDRLRDHLGLVMTFEEFKTVWNPIFWENLQVKAAIGYLKAKGYPLFLLSDTNELHFTYIHEQYPIVHAFDEWILSFEVGVKKPEKRIYDVIFEKLTVERQEVFYIDDMERYVEAAREYGLQGMVFRDEATFWRRLKEMGV